ncbi:hypothetical protein SAMN03159341_101687 [Paenibacillus sp. 1_12]|uniref:hypothetical protein n=1 Tax=Paenibacillus sp. 1_12 TaxID=1566278 RepID=UPI0008DF8E7F|nr:hypothetical protein [Paenibacillus sp. 1_12]SFK81286.1 hypothetical protein SAMN03159341_101687 [Paenibacillus sp. 1_12]
MNLDERGYVACIQQGYDAWQTGDDYTGLCWFQQACLLWLDELDHDGVSLSETACSLIFLQMTHLLDTLEHGDISSATDLIGHTLLPSLKGGLLHDLIHS